ncbi:MAG: ABC transporter ATP-binding protein [Chloroflexota bacterium]|nr:ABC transporter ATP-binding protein [Chloroflexota bacterium]
MCAIERDEAGTPRDFESQIDPALAISGLCFAYSDGTRALSDIDLEVMAGERLGVIGPNGAGKTTLFLIICGILEKSSGTITVLGKSPAKRHFRPDIGLVFQNPDDQLFCPSVRDDVAFGLRNMGLPKDEVEARATQALSTVGCLELAGRPVHHLSEGEKRMVSIAGVLAMEPQLVIYDEPSANLDIRSRRRLIRLLQASNETMLIAAHDLELILEVCGRVILIDNGRVVADGTPREIMGNDELMEAHGQEKPHSLVPHAKPHTDTHRSAEAP